MLRVKIDLRQPMFLLTLTEDRDRFKQGSRNTRFPSSVFRTELVRDGQTSSHSEVGHVPLDVRNG